MISSALSAGASSVKRSSTFSMRDRLDTPGDRKDLVVLRALAGLQHRVAGDLHRRRPRIPLAVAPEVARRDADAPAQRREVALGAVHRERVVQHAVARRELPRQELVLRVALLLRVIGADLELALELG